MMNQVMKILVPVIFCCLAFARPATGQSADRDVQLSVHGVISGTFLGNGQRNFYGRNAPSRLDILWKYYLGQGETTISRKIGNVTWAGAGWTGQPLLFIEEGELFIIQGAYDHHLRKLRASDAELVWKYKFDDVVKGTGTLWINPDSPGTDNQVLILQGSRLGKDTFLDARHVPSFRAISAKTGKEVWRFDSKWTDSYSRDVDGSALVLGDTVYIGLENSLFTLFTPDPLQAVIKDGMLQPRIHREIRLYNQADVIKHNHNVVTESSPAVLGDRIYISSGSGHVWGYNRTTGKLDWDFYIGSDMDGSVVVTGDSCILASVEKQYIDGPGGIFKLDPSRPPAESVVWFFPTGNNKFSSWEGGVIGSAAVNDLYRDPSTPSLAAFSGIDGYLYVIDHQHIYPDSLARGPDGHSRYPVPELVFKYRTGASISTPVFSENRLIAAGYGGIYLFSYENGVFNLMDHYKSVFEATPVFFDRKIYIASRDGYLYCLGEK